MDLSKRDKKIARQLIEKGLQLEFQNGLSAMYALLQEWKQTSPSDNKASYHLLYKTVIDFDKGIARRYDNMSGSRYFLIVAEQLMEGLLQEADLEEFSPEIRQKPIPYLDERQG